jgi:hypothetical protein
VTVLSLNPDKKGLTLFGSNPFDTFLEEAFTNVKKLLHSLTT